jgi:hypothetical protein
VLLMSTSAQELREEVRRQLVFHPVETLDQVLAVALAQLPERALGGTAPRGFGPPVE